ncbi:MAG: PAS domain S-box protein [Candidatus Obscuribacter sp.]|jgi:PAS domain S-box-containing protein|nr:PAS domain S-box protein [Candidatus Obscuribacter sp.]MBK9619165.1 PAS domain S-box protein [Candidatus Obscuribacter sp.]MBK9769431.1 PAS domain S-box protein [Candidatus Obscuribacter sp.]
MDFWNAMTNGFMPHGYCLKWDGPLLTVMIAANIGIALAYFAIPIALRYFVGTKKDLPYPYMFKLFAAFILSCGMTHLAKILTLFQPLYWIEAGLDLLTAIISLLTAFLLLPIIPKALKLRSPKDLEVANQELAEANKKLASSELEMQRQVDERTRELSEAVERLKVSEAQFKSLFDFMPQLGWTAEPDGSIDFFNKGWYEYVGGAWGQMHGWNWEEVHHPDYLEEVVKNWTHSLETKTPFEMQFPLKSKDGNYRWFITRVRPMFDADGKLVKWIGINTDIEDSRNAAEKLEQKVKERTAQLDAARLEAVRANELKSQFVANISHEIRTPMSGVLGLSELLTLETEGEVQETAQHIQTAAQNLMALVNDLLDLSKLEAGKIDIVKEDFVIASTVEQVIEVFSVSAANKNLEVTRIVSAEAEKLVRGDQGKIRQILQNLVQNAIKFTDSGSVVVSVALQKRQDGLSYFQFSVKDTGPGIAAETQKRLFQLFVQGDGSTTRRHGGTGLGLALSKRLVEAMHGVITVDSVEGKGSCFAFTIPLETLE